jgi:hypothetical protein
MEQEPILNENIFSNRELYKSLSALYSSKNFNRGTLYKNIEVIKEKKKFF